VQSTDRKVVLVFPVASTLRNQVSQRLDPTVDVPVAILPDSDPADPLDPECQLERGNTKISDFVADKKFFVVP
jgi:hypothetical protein